MVARSKILDMIVDVYNLSTAVTSARNLLYTAATRFAGPRLVMHAGLINTLGTVPHSTSARLSNTVCMRGVALYKSRQGSHLYDAIVVEDKLDDPDADLANHPRCMLDEARNFAGCTIGSSDLAGWRPSLTGLTRQPRCAVTMPDLAACPFWVATSLHLQHGDQHHQQYCGQDELQLGCHHTIWVSASQDASVSNVSQSWPSPCARCCMHVYANFTELY